MPLRRRWRSATPKPTRRRARWRPTRTAGQHHSSTRTDWLPNYNMDIYPDRIDTVNVSTSTSMPSRMAGGAAVTVVAKSARTSSKGRRSSQRRQAECRVYNVISTPRPSQIQHLRRSARRPIARNEVVLRIIPRLQTEAESVHVLQSAGRGAPRWRLHQSDGQDHERATGIYDPLTGMSTVPAARSRAT
jgi:hypothetical protein